MFVVLRGFAAERGVAAGMDWVVAGSSGAWVSWSERRISIARASGSAGTTGERPGIGPREESFRGSQGVGAVSG